MEASIRDILRLYWKHVRTQKHLVVMLAVGIALVNAIDLVIPLYYKKFFNLLAGNLPSDEQVQSLLGVLFVIVGFHALEWLFRRADHLTNNVFQPRVMASLLTDSYDYLQHHSFGFFANRFIGALVRKLTRLTRAFEVFADRVTWDLYHLVLAIIGPAIILATINGLLVALFVGWALLFIGLNVLFVRWKYRYDVARAQKDTEVTAVLADAISNHENIRLFDGFGHESARVRKVAGELQTLRTLTWNLDAISDAVQSALFIGIEFALMITAVRLWRQGVLTVGDFVLIQAYLLQLIHRLWDVGRYLRDLYESFSDAQEMVGILNTPHEVRDVPGAKPLVVGNGGIEFWQVNFSFQQTRRVLADFTLAIAPGEKVALVGPSGAGKTSAMKLLLRLHDVESGKILIDGQRINRVTLFGLRSAIALVPQEPILFHRSLLENIRYGRRDATEAEVVAAAKAAHADEFIESFPEGYQTYVGERGVKLSGGERQRVAIARAILKSAPILVLDEATSSLDSHSESLIQDALKKLMAGKTVIVIAHRLSTIRQMDRIIVMEGGRITDEGTHEQLLAKDGLYAMLWEIQAGGFLADDEQDKN